MTDTNPKKDNDDGGDNLVLRSISVDKEIWKLAKQRAKSNNLSISSIVRQLLRAWVEGRIQITINGEDD